MLMDLKAGVAAVLVMFAAAACGGEEREGTPPPPLAGRCGAAAAELEARPLWFRASDGTKLDGADAGDGPRGVILLHQSPSDLCEWVPYATTLTHAGFHVLLVDLRGFGLSRGAPSGEAGARADVRGAVDELRSLGADKVALVGASYGGATAMVAAPSLGDDIAGVANLSGELVLHQGGADELNALAAVEQLHVPFLVLASKRDRYLDAADARKLYRAAATRRKSIALFRGDAHGLNLLYLSKQRTRVHRLLQTFLRSVTE